MPSIGFRALRPSDELGRSPDKRNPGAVCPLGSAAEPARPFQDYATPKSSRSIRATTASGGGSKFNDQPVPRGLGCNGVAATKHIVAHVGENEAFWPDQRQLFDQLTVGKVHLDRLVVHVGLRHEQISIAPKLDQAVRPFGIAAKGEHLAVDRYTITVVGFRWRAVTYLSGKNFSILEMPRVVRRELDQRYLELLHRTRRSRKGRLHQAREPFLDRARPRDSERVRAP